jgi:hypothetical protein
MFSPMLANGWLECQQPVNYSQSRMHTDWAVLVAQAERLSDQAFRSEAFGFARQLCARARSNIERLVQGLSRAGYVFAFPDRAHVPDDGHSPDWVSEFERLGVHLPIFLQAWVAEVGSVNLMGSHPSWPESGYSGLPPSEAGVWYTDALVLELDRDSLESEYEDWRSRVEEDGRDEVGPFHLAIAPDHIHKANVSEGLPYAIETTVASVDTLLLTGASAPACFTTSTMHSFGAAFRGLRTSTHGYRIQQRLFARIC